MELALTQSTMILKWKCKNASVLKLIIFEFEFFNMHTSYEHPTKRYINEERSKRKSIKFSFPKTRSLHGVPCTVCTVKYTLNHSQNAFATVNTSNFVHVARKLTASNRANVYTRGNIAQRLTHTHTHYTVDGTNTLESEFIVVVTKIVERDECARNMDKDET